MNPAFIGLVAFKPFARLSLAKRYVKSLEDDIVWPHKYKFIYGNTFLFIDTNAGLEIFNKRIRFQLNGKLHPSTRC